MPTVIARNVLHISNPDSPSEGVVVTTLAFVADESMDLAEAMSSLGVEPGEWESHKHLSADSSAALWVLTRSHAS